ncbi:MAG: excinuclease ABC subunit UvrA [Cyclobacteriaceae bacterium]|nr:excinuclease ABC subunit UvrA [Cyclobacteriaceae bacterium]
MTTNLQIKPKDILENLDPKKYILIKGARVNNLKNLSVAIPRNKLVVITGLSGSGKSSLAFDTLFAEGQRMYVESLSAYARQFLGRMEKPEVDYIKGISPAIAIEQKVNTRNPRSTVGTSTEIYDYLKLLFARVGDTFSPISGNIVSRDTVTDVVNYIQGVDEGTRFMILSPLKQQNGRGLDEELKILLSKGFTRVAVRSEVVEIEELLQQNFANLTFGDIRIVIDRASVVKDDEDNLFRISDSVQTAFFEGHDECIVHFMGGEEKHFSDKFEADGILFEEPNANFFSFNNPYGACKRCEGFGKILGIDPDLVIQDPNLSVYEGAIVPWRSEGMRKWLNDFLRNASKIDFPIHRPYKDLSKNQQELLWTGNEYFQGIDDFFQYLETQTHKIQYRVMLSRYRGRTVCPDCRGTKLRKDAAYVKIDGKSIVDLVLMQINELNGFFADLSLNEYKTKVSKRILKEIKNRISYIEQVGLGYLTLNRLTSSLSGGEFQRIKLATSLGSSLVGSMYILDEPSIGLHPRDTTQLIRVLKYLRDLGNTVIVVEHEEEIMQAADQIIDIGPEAGTHGGELVFQGDAHFIPEPGLSHTTRFLSGLDQIEVPAIRRSWKHAIEIYGARENNLKSIDVKIPLGVLTAITGVSGSGKSTLVKRIIYPAIGKRMGIASEISGKYDRVEGDLDMISSLEYIDQHPIGKSSRSNPVTYVKAYDLIRQLFSEQSLAKARGYKPSFFSFNVEGGRCEECQGEGTVKIEMQFMADIYLTCESCHGQRFKSEILEVTYQGKTISDVLDLTVDDAMGFFKEKKGIISKLKPLQDVGLGYIGLGQSSNTLSGGEAQRVKLASFLGKGGSSDSDRTLFIFDEPTTGLHFHDIEKLLLAINALIHKGHSVIIIEHNVEVIKSADWIIDLGPEGGDLGGQLVFQGTPEDMIKLDNNHTAHYLKQKIRGN